MILNRSNNAVNNAIIQAPQNATRAEHFLTSRTANTASQPAGLNGRQATINIPARSISTVIFTL